MRSKISSKLIFASCVGYFDRAYYGFYVTSSRTLILIEGGQNLTAVELSECINMRLWICLLYTSPSPRDQRGSRMPSSAWKKKIRCEIEDFVETHLSKLRGMLRSRVLRVLCDLIKNVNSLLRGTKSDSCGPQRIYKYAAVAMYATVFKNVCTLLGESGKLLLVIG